MTSERMLLRKQGHIVARIKPRRTSKTECLSEWFFGTDGDDCLGARC